MKFKFISKIQDASAEYLRFIELLIGLSPKRMETKGTNDSLLERRITET